MARRRELVLVVLAVLLVVVAGQGGGWSEEVGNQVLKCRVEWSPGRPVRWSLFSASGVAVSVGNTVPAVQVAGHGPLEPLKARAALISTGHDKRALVVTEAARTRDGAVDVELRRYFEVTNATHPVVRMWAQVDAATSSASDSFVSGCELVSVGVQLPSGVDAGLLFTVDQFNWPFKGTSTMAPRSTTVSKGQWPNLLRMGSQPSQLGQLTQCAWFALQAAVSPAPTGVFVGIEFNGKSEAQAVVAVVPHINHTLAGFQLPAVFVGLFDGDWDEAGYRTQRYVEAAIAIPIPLAYYPFVQYDSWQWGVNINVTDDQVCVLSEETMLREIELAHAIGLEVFVLDLGWAAQVGDWRPDPVKFPRGLRQLADRAHSYGMLFGLHMPAAQAALTAPIVIQHPDWLAYNNSNEYFGASAVCLSHEPVRQWLVSQLVGLVDHYRVDYFVQDGEDMVKHCAKDTHTHNHGDENYSNAVEGIDWVWRELRRLRPRVVLENCEDGGNMLTQRIPGIYHTSISVDDTDVQATRLGVYGMSYPFSLRYSARYLQDAPSNYTLRSVMFGGPLILQLNLTSLTPDQLALTAHHVNEYKRYRALIRDGKVHHLQRPTEDGTGYDAIQSVDAERSRSVAFVYHARQAPGSDPASSFALKPRGLDAARRYEVVWVDAGVTVLARGDALMAEGLAVALAPCRPPSSRSMPSRETLTRVT